MKFGVVWYKDTTNIGDDIQTFAAMQHLPRVDCFLDRESLDAFEPADGKPVAVPMCGWYMHRKWNWPPSRFVVPLLTSMHYDANRDGERPGCPATTEFLAGCGLEWLKASGPVGCRDFHTLELFRKLGIDAFFSGCITLTLPQTERKVPGKEYICACDLPPHVLRKLKAAVAGRCEVVETTHSTASGRASLPWAEREKAVVELLSLYRNAKCVVTKRLHCALPCLATGVPVFVVNERENPDAGRYAPYYDWIRHCTNRQFIEGDFDYDFLSPPPNGTRHLPVREALVSSLAAFVARWKDEDGPPERYARTRYTAGELARWRVDAMRRCLDGWQAESMESKRETRELRRFRAKAAALEEFERETAHWRKLFACRPVRWAIRLRNLFLPQKPPLQGYAGTKAKHPR